MRNRILLTPVTGLLLLLAVTTGVRADSWRGPLQGGLIGGAVGALISRSSEIDSRVADGPQSVILEQVTYGIAVRMAVMSMIMGGSANP